MRLSQNTILSLPALVTRLVVGFVFAFGAWTKFQNIENVITQFTQQTGFSFIAPLTYLVCGIELVGGLFLIIGFLTRWTVLPLIAIEAIAIFTVKAHLMTSLAATLNLTETLYILLFFWLFVNGPGRFSLDHLWRSKSSYHKVNT
jgi:putative oxidoreductase